MKNLIKTTIEENNSISRREIFCIYLNLGYSRIEIFKALKELTLNREIVATLIEGEFYEITSYRLS